jgi:hypothetical protein
VASYNLPPAYGARDCVYVLARPGKWSRPHVRKAKIPLIFLLRKAKAKTKTQAVRLAHRRLMARVDWKATDALERPV